MGGQRESTELELIDRALAGDRSAFSELVQRNQERLFASMMQVTGSPEEAEEVVQEAFIRAFIKLDSFQKNSQFFTWIYRIAFNSALTRQRKKRAKISLDQIREEKGMEVVGDHATVDEPMLRDERVQMVRQAIDTLTHEHRQILILREMDEFAYEEIAEILQISIGTVRSRLSRARNQLKLAIESMESEGTSPR
ncbi:ECF RNA polymerase sigma factor SigW [Stieleria bergensis]|uniref:RNA polymerase sigma factor n=1 Tax=Stieleria bergensis TaxID=2528025 RepID=A0A517T1A9_9BACT|nr:ECF RNA polymerase sigma factor SigW [Planctomycetes bacterium SV_7m_r]